MQKPKAMNPCLSCWDKETPYASDFVELWAHLNNGAPIDAFDTFYRLYTQGQNDEDR